MMGVLETHADKWMPVTETGCYLWTGAVVGRLRRPTPQIWFEGKPRSVSRLVLEEAAGPAPTVKHHAAHNTPNGCVGGFCVNPDHLRWATPSENSLDRPVEARQEKIFNRWKEQRTYDLPRWITFDKKLKKYKVVCSSKYLGYFVSLDEAIIVRDKYLGVK